MKSSTLAAFFAVLAALHFTGCGGRDPNSPGTFEPFIVFESDLINHSIWRVNLYGSGRTMLVASESYFGSTNNRGTLLVFNDAALQLFVKDLETGATTPLAPSPAISYRASFNRSGTRVVFVSERDGGDREIWIINTDGTGLTRLTNRDGEDSFPSFSPDGQKIVFSARIGGTSQVWVMNTDGSGLANLSNNSFDDATSSFSRDGSQIVFSSNRSGDYDLYRMSATGSAQTQLFHVDGDQFQSGFTPDGRLVFWGEAPAGPPGIYIANTNGSGLDRISPNNVHETRSAGIIPDGTH